MFFFTLGLFCGVFLAQEVPSVPKLKPYLDRLWIKLNGMSTNLPEEEEDTGESSKSD